MNISRFYLAVKALFLLAGEEGAGWFWLFNNLKKEKKSVIQAVVCYVYSCYYKHNILVRNYGALKLI